MNTQPDGWKLAAAGVGLATGLGYLHRLTKKRPARFGGLRGTPPSEKTVFDAKTRGGKYRIVVKRVGRNDYRVESFTGGRSSGAGSGFDKASMIKWVNNELRGAKAIDGINYKVVSDTLRSKGNGVGGLGALTLKNRQGKTLTYNRDEMVGGTQERPVLKWITRDLILPDTKTGAVFRIDPGSYSVPDWYVATSPTEGRALPVKEADELERLWCYIESNKWISARVVAGHRAKLKEAKKRIAAKHGGGLSGGSVAPKSGTIRVTFENDEFGACTGRAVAEKWHRCFSRVAEDNGAGSMGEGFYEGGRSCQEVLQAQGKLTPRREAELDAGRNVTVAMDPWEAGHLYGYDAHACAESPELLDPSYYNRRFGKQRFWR